MAHTQSSLHMASAAPASPRRLSWPRRRPPCASLRALVSRKRKFLRAPCASGSATKQGMAAPRARTASASPKRALPRMVATSATSARTTSASAAGCAPPAASAPESAGARRCWKFAKYSAACRTRARGRRRHQTGQSRVAPLHSGMLFTHGGCLWRNSKPGRSRAHAPQRLRQQQRCTARGGRICARPLEPEPLEPAPVPRTVRLPVPLPVYKGPHGGRDYQGGVRRRTSSALGSASAAQPPPAATAASKCECMADSTANTCGTARVRVPTPAARAHRRRCCRRPPQPGLPCWPRLVRHCHLNILLDCSRFMCLL